MALRTIPSQLMPAFPNHQATELVRVFGNYDSIQNAIDLSAANVSGVAEILVSVPITLTANITLINPLRIAPGGSIALAGFTLTINKSFSAGIYQVFSGAGSVVFGPNAAPHTLLEWWGALGDGTTDDTTAIQAAFTASVTTGVVNARIPIMPLGNKTYRITSINVPARCTVYSPMGRTSGPTFQALSAATMFVCPTAYSENQITFRGGINIDGNNLSACTFDVAGATGIVLDGVNFSYTTLAIKMVGNTGGLAWINRCRFNGDITTIIQIGANALKIQISQCMFASTSVTGIYTDATWFGDSLHIKDCSFDLPGNTYNIRLLRLDNNSATLHAVIEGNRFDGSATDSSIHIGRYTYANIQSNSISGSASGAAMNIDGDECYVANNFVAEKPIAFTTNSRYCVAGPQKWGGFSPHYTNAGTDNVIEVTADSYVRKGTTAQRPLLLATGQVGTLYLDTTLDADGKPIWWNNTAWVDATGAVV